jgi:2-keto-4-pentenoate hydratase/2-oxohepta-3-ene-1,7-dioic acid hydratase in catechol pathway
VSWGLCTIELDGVRRPAAYVVADDSVVDLPVRYASVLAILDDWREASAALRQFRPESRPRLTGYRLRTPLLYPRKLLGAGANYRDHVLEMTGNEPSDGWQSWFFLSPPTTTVIGPDEPVLISGDPADGMDWEAELGVVIGRRARDIGVDEVDAHIAGFVIANDITARGLLPRQAFPHPAFAFDWIAAKSQDTFWPIGPAIVPSWLVEDPGSLPVRLWVNDELKQDGCTADLIVGWRQLVSDASRRITLEPGDVIGTGTPAGVGAPRGEFLKHGDVVRVEVGGLGSLSNPIVERGSRG